MRAALPSRTAALAVTLVVLACAAASCAPRSRTPLARSGAAKPQLLALDHAWVVVTPGAPERLALERAGLRLAPGVNRHEGQGTASITVELENAFVELLWPDSSVAVAPGTENIANRFRRRMAWRSSGWSPLGIGFRRTDARAAPLPFPTRPVRAAWMPPGAALALLTRPADSLGPSLWVVPAVMGVKDAPGADSVLRGASAWAPLRHPLGVRRLTAARVIAPAAATLPPVSYALDSLGVVGFARGPAWLLELTFDGGRRGGTRDLRPELPVVLRF